MFAARNRSPVTDPAAFAQLYSENFARVWRVLRRLGVGEASLDDASHDVFVIAWRRGPEFAGRSSVQTWLLGIAIRVASDARRGQLRRMEPLPDSLVAPENPEAEAHQPPALPAPSPVAPAASVEAPATRGASDPHLSRAREAPASREVPSDPEVAAEDPAPPLMDSATPTAVLPPEAPARCERSTELLFLDAAEADLNRDQPVAALAWLDSYYKRCPSGAWDARAWLIRTGSLCALGRMLFAA